MATQGTISSPPSFQTAEIKTVIEPPAGFTVLLYTRHRGPSKYFRYDLFDGKPGDKNVAYVVVKTMHGKVYADGLRVDPQYQGKGLARYLLKLAIANHGEQHLYLRARPFKEHPGGLNKAQLIAFYQRYGFTLLNDKGLMVLPLNNA